MIKLSGSNTYFLMGDPIVFIDLDQLNIYNFHNDFNHLNRGEISTLKVFSSRHPARFKVRCLDDLSPIGNQQIPLNNALFDRKNDDLDSKPGPIYQFIASILIAYLGPTPFFQTGYRK